MRRFTIMLLAALVAAVALAVPASPAAAKSYVITNVTIDAQVQPNGDVRVHEERVLGFSGSFSYVYWDIGMKGSKGIKVLGASGPEGRSEERRVGKECR